ncbi:hypothetical protein KBZ15_16495 [Cyanobium sp. BA20m-p-22]|uniref:hypothetical protein n=1 Tax=Cyanobium sp. BA20m-p-22 TaxID=2823704 RepID=UPI0020CCAEB5|nr:hypothetical protein [Cyanobium sp. BA20m-p-22]MCP9911490.1 hypothetical protein [Cyanobium sp. BA20m-p-22]
MAHFARGVHAGLLAPAAHPVGDVLPRQVAVSTRRWEQPGIGGAAAKRLEQRPVSAVILMVCAFEPLPSRCIWPQCSMASKSHQLNLASSDTATDQIGP